MNRRLEACDDRSRTSGVARCQSRASQRRHGRVVRAEIGLHGAEAVLLAQPGFEGLQSFLQTLIEQRADRFAAGVSHQLGVTPLNQRMADIADIANAFTVDHHGAGHLLRHPHRRQGQADTHRGEQHRESGQYQHL